MWIITFKVRSLAQSDQTRRVITTFTPVWPGFEPSFFSFFEKISIPPKNCCTPFFRSFLSVIFCSFPPPPLFFFHARVDLQAFENWSRVHNRVSDRRNYIRGSLLPAYLSARHQILIFLHEYDNDSPAPWTCLLQKLGGHRSVQIEKGPVFHGRARGNDDSRGWLEAPGWIRNEAHDSCLPIEEGSRGSSTGVFCKEISTDRAGRASSLPRYNDGTSSIR